jgi:hypothetical protein
MSYIRLEKRDDWGQVYFSLPGRGLSPHGTADKAKYGLRFERGESLRVRWPDGAETVERVVFETQSREIQDMGNRYTSTCDVPGIRVDVHGIARWVSLAEVQVHEGDLVGPELRRADQKRSDGT